MFADYAQVTGLLSKSVLFRSLKPEQIQGLAAEFEPFSLEDGEKACSSGDHGESMYMILFGKIRLTRGAGESQKELGVLVPGDYFGEEAVLQGRSYIASATAIGKTHLLRLNREGYARIIREHSYVKTFLSETVKSRSLARSKSQSWLTTSERIYLLERKSRNFLWISLIKSLVLGWVGVMLLIFAVGTGSGSFQVAAGWLGGIVLLCSFLWGIWIWIDWGNDYYIVTSSRVVWVEKVILLYESRHEAPLSTILTVGVDTDFWGRALGYGDVGVRTYTGKITLRFIDHPDYVSGVILEQQDRTKVVVKETEIAELEGAIRRKLGYTTAPAAQAGPVAATPEAPSKRKPRRSMGVFMIRFEQKGVVTFRKHWILLLKSIALPTLGMVLILGILAGRFLEYFTFLSLPVCMMVNLTALFILFLVWIYRYVDWRNDIYQLTDSQIIDIYRKPLGAEDKKTADLDNILTIRHLRRGIVGLIFNFGDVIAMVGTTEFTFDGVYKPAEVEQEIVERMSARKEKQKKDESAREQERIAEWVSVYHKIESERKSGDGTGFTPKTG